MTTEIAARGTATIEGRDFAVEASVEPTFKSATSIYGEVTLTGVRGARYTSERWNGTSTLRFWNDRLGRGRLPGVMFDARQYVLDEGTEGDEITIREATYAEAKEAHETFWGGRA